MPSAAATEDLSTIDGRLLRAKIIEIKDELSGLIFLKCDADGTKLKETKPFATSPDKHKKQKKKKTKVHTTSKQTEDKFL